MYNNESTKLTNKYKFRRMGWDGVGDKIELNVTCISQEYATMTLQKHRNEREKCAQESMKIKRTRGKRDKPSLGRCYLSANFLISKEKLFYNDCEMNNGKE